MNWSVADGSVTTGIAVGAAALLVGAVVWRTVVRLRFRRAVARGLRSTDPNERAATVWAVAGQGLRVHGRCLWALARTEDDPTVRAVLATAVARNQWEPATDRRLLALRVWADGVRADAAAAAADAALEFGTDAAGAVASADTIGHVGAPRSTPTLVVVRRTPAVSGRSWPDSVAPVA